MIPFDLLKLLILTCKLLYFRKKILFVNYNVLVSNYSILFVIKHVSKQCILYIYTTDILILIYDVVFFNDLNVAFICSMHIQITCIKYYAVKLYYFVCILLLFQRFVQFDSISIRFIDLIPQKYSIDQENSMMF